MLLKYALFRYGSNPPIQLVGKTFTKKVVARMGGILLYMMITSHLVLHKVVLQETQFNIEYMLTQVTT